MFVFIGLYFLGGATVPTCTSRSSTTSCGDPGWVLGIGIVIVLGGLFLFYRTITQRDTRYYLTTFRLVRTSGGRIVKQISRALLRGRVLSQFLYVVPFNTNRGVQTYGVRILDS